MDQFINDLDLGVDILFEQYIEGYEADGKRQAKGNSHIIPTMFKVIVDRRDSNSNRQGIYKNKYAQFHTSKVTICMLLRVLYKGKLMLNYG